MPTPADRALPRLGLGRSDRFDPRETQASAEKNIVRRIAPQSPAAHHSEWVAEALRQAAGGVSPTAEDEAAHSIDGRGADAVHAHE
jgi:hypothetical protein